MGAAAALGSRRNGRATPVGKRAAKRSAFPSAWDRCRYTKRSGYDRHSVKGDYQRWQPVQVPGDVIKDINLHMVCWTELPGIPVSSQPLTVTIALHMALMRVGVRVPAETTPSAVSGILSISRQPVCGDQGGMLQSRGGADAKLQSRRNARPAFRQYTSVVDALGDRPGTHRTTCWAHASAC